MPRALAAEHINIVVADTDVRNHAEAQRFELARSLRSYMQVGQLGNDGLLALRVRCDQLGRSEAVVMWSA